MNMHEQYWILHDISIEYYSVRNNRYRSDSAILV